MSRAAAGFAGIHLVFVAAGLGLLAALGFVRRPRDLIGAIGPAYLVGLAGVMPVLILLLVLDEPIRLPQLLAVALAIAAGAAAIRVLVLRRAGAHAPPAPEERPAARAHSWAARVAIAGLAIYFAVGASAFAKLPTGNDDWGFWSYKALAFYDFGGRLHPDLFTGRIPGPSHLDYPVMHSLLESLFFRAMGGVYLQEWHIALWVIYAAFIWTVGFLLRSRGVDWLVVLVPLGALALAPGATAWVSAGEADVSVACFVAAGALAVALWLDGGPIGLALLGGAFLGAAANTKDEGLAAAIAVFVAAAAVRAVARAPRPRGLLAFAGVTAAAVAPWIVWRSAHGLENSDRPGLSTGLDPGYLTGRIDRLGAAVGKLGDQLAAQGSWLWVVPCFGAVAVVCIWTGAARRLAAFYLGTGVMFMLTLYWVYWSGKLEVLGWLAASAPRVVTSAVFIAGVGVAHLLARLLFRRGRD